MRPIYNAEFSPFCPVLRPKMSVDKEDENGQQSDSKKSFIVDKYFEEIVQAWDRENHAAAAAAAASSPNKQNSNVTSYNVRPNGKCNGFYFYLAEHAFWGLCDGVFLCCATLRLLLL